MGNLKVRIELNRGKVGIPLNKLGNIVGETHRFLSLAGKDIGISDDPSIWIARDFKNGSVNFDCYHENGLTPDTVDRGNQIFRSIMNNDRSDPALNVQIRPVTRLQYAKVADSIGPDETISFGLYTNDEKTPSEWHELTKETSSKIVKETPKTIFYYGEIQGTVHSLYKESKSPKVVVRELSTNILVNCFFKSSLYQEAVETLHNPKAVIFVEGEVVESREQANGEIKSIDVSHFRLAPEFDESFFKRFIGSQPHYTGELTTEEWMKEVRGQ